ncbi:unnamed protein product [Urochloa humidicola]
MVGVGTVVDAAIGWLVESILGNFLGGSFEAWIRGVGLAEDVEELKAAVRSVQMVVAAAKGRKIENKPLARSLDDLKELLYDADDVMDELDYYRLKLQVESAVAPAVGAYRSLQLRKCSSHRVGKLNLRNMASRLLPTVAVVEQIRWWRRDSRDRTTAAAGGYPRDVI